MLFMFLRFFSIFIFYPTRLKEINPDSTEDSIPDSNLRFLFPDVQQICQVFPSKSAFCSQVSFFFWVFCWVSVFQLFFILFLFCFSDLFFIFSCFLDFFFWLLLVFFMFFLDFGVLWGILKFTRLDLPEALCHVVPCFGATEKPGTMGHRENQGDTAMIWQFLSTINKDYRSIYGGFLK